MQNQIHEALIKLGFEKQGNSYKKDGYPIVVYENSTLESIFKELIKFGSTQKVWEIKRVMEIIDPSY